MELEFWDHNPSRIVRNILPTNFYFKPTSINKTRKFYEFILIDTNSVSIKHYKDKNDPFELTHSII